MPVLKDMTGWRQELREFNERSDESVVQFYDRWINKIPPKIPVSQVLEFIETVLGDDELRDALRQRIWWNQVLIEHGGIIESEHPKMRDCPHEAFGILEDIFYWFCWKNGYEPVSEAFETGGIYAAMDILAGDLPDVHSSKVRNHLLGEYAVFIEADKIG